MRCLLGKNLHFLKSMDARYLYSIWISGVVQYNPQRCSAKFYGLGCWGWAVVNSDRWEVNKILQALPEGPGSNLFHWKGTDRKIIKTQIIRFTKEGRQLSSGWTLFIYSSEPSKTIATPNSSVVDAWLWIVLFPAKRGFKTGPSPQTPGPSPKCQEYYLENPW